MSFSIIKNKMIQDNTSKNKTPPALSVPTKDDEEKEESSSLQSDSSKKPIQKNNSQNRGTASMSICQSTSSSAIADYF